MHPELRFIRRLVKMYSRKQERNSNYTQYNKKNNPLNKKIAVSVVTAVFLVILYVLIFSFSEQDGQTSGSLSRMISEKCVEFIKTLSGSNWSKAVMDAMAEYFEHPIRKLAHFAEYAFMAVLVYIMWRPWKERDKRLYRLIILWVAVSAAGDEIHQLFVPDRYGSVADVLLDTCGGMMGVWICALAEKLAELKNKKRKNG